MYTYICIVFYDIHYIIYIIISTWYKYILAETGNKLFIVIAIDNRDINRYQCIILKKTLLLWYVFIKNAYKAIP